MLVRIKEMLQSDTYQAMLMLGFYMPCYNLRVYTHESHAITLELCSCIHVMSMLGSFPDVSDAKCRVHAPWRKAIPELGFIITRSQLEIMYIWEYSELLFKAS